MNIFVNKRQILNDWFEITRTIKYDLCQLELFIRGKIIFKVS